MLNLLIITYEKDCFYVLDILDKLKIIIGNRD